MKGFGTTYPFFGYTLVMDVGKVDSDCGEKGFFMSTNVVEGV